jgi:hypothetical protein
MSIKCEKCERKMIDGDYAYGVRIINNKHMLICYMCFTEYVDRHMRFEVQDLS